MDKTPCPPKPAIMISSFILILFWGLFPGEREERVNKLNESLDKEITGAEIDASKDFRETMKRCREVLFNKMSDDERNYYLAEERFKKDIEEINMRYMQKTNDEIHKQYIDAIRQEYKGRSRSVMECTM